MSLLTGPFPVSHQYRSRLSPTPSQQEWSIRMSQLSVRIGTGQFWAEVGRNRYSGPEGRNLVDSRQGVQDLSALAITDGEISEYR